MFNKECVFCLQVEMGAKAMTTGAERTRALIYVGDFLEQLAASNNEVDIGELREHAKNLLRHYPSSMEIEWIASAVAYNPQIPLGSVLDPSVVPHQIHRGYRRW